MGTVISPLGSLLEELREERLAGLGHRAQREATLLARPAPDIHFMVGATRGSPGLRLLPASSVVHAALGIAALVVPLLRADTLPPLASGTRVFFAAPMVAPPPPPPPAPRTAALPRARPQPPRPATPVFTAPAETPEAIVPEETADLGVPGETGGVEGGVPGGVVGGLVGGLPDPPFPPPAMRVGGAIREPAKLRHVDPVYPDIAVRANVEGVVIVECLVSPQGRVTHVRVLRGIPLLNTAALEAVRQWVYTPTLVDGVPVPVVMTVTVRFALLPSLRARG